MRNAVRRNLIDALEGGHYLRGSGFLKTVHQDGRVRHCVTGILCELYEKATGYKAGKFIRSPVSELEGCGDIYLTLKKQKAIAIYTIFGHMESPPYRVVDWAGCTHDEIDHLISMVDEGKTFKAIAKVLVSQE